MNTKKEKQKDLKRCKQETNCSSKSTFQLFIVLNQCHKCIISAGSSPSPVQHKNEISGITRRVSFYFFSCENAHRHSSAVSRSCLSVFSFACVFWHQIKKKKKKIKPELNSACNCRRVHVYLLQLSATWQETPEVIIRHWSTFNLCVLFHVKFSVLTAMRQKKVP